VIVETESEDNLEVGDETGFTTHCKWFASTAIAPVKLQMLVLSNQVI